MASAGLRLPLVTYPIHAYVSEPLKPVLDTVVMALHSHISLSQSDKGELVFGGAREDFASYHQGSAIRIVEEQLAALIDLFPPISRLRMLRQWAGIVDCTPDASPILGRAPLDGLYLNCGWGTGGFKATPGAGSVFAHTIATGAPHPLAVPFGLARFESGRLLDETAASGAASH
jgi:sarcosine oxidase subunit beta